QTGARGTIDLLVQGFHLVGELGRLQIFDPGRPTVPDFGRKLYHLSPPRLAAGPVAPVARKLARRCQPLELPDVRIAFKRFVARLDSAILGGIVLDYDGTMCSRSERFGDLRADLASECRRLLEGGLVIGIATGRGRSVR